MHAINRQFPIMRFPITSALAMIVTLALMALMQQLIKTDFVVIDDTIPTKINPPFMEKTKPTVHKKDPTDDRPEEIDPPPIFEIPDALVESEPSLGAVVIKSPTTKLAIDHHQGFNIVDGEAIPVVRVAPEYPARAQQRGIEGFVDVQFDVAPSGKTTNLQVIYAEPGSVFNRAALRAVGKWKYKPKVINGNAVAQLGLQTRVRFGLEE